MDIKTLVKLLFLNKLVKFFTAHNFKVGTIKHDGHDFETTNYLEDNFQHFNSGAKKVLSFLKINGF